ncbi:hypothetical protein [Cellvibrio fibrivorans]|uniref:Uncharacterized protein n=1 Tax=Cellvibrio fibrivorans TaxID=126350 RepID=A0ABU1V4F3_9GAMM|nr:hypothetical protein [Cellvibrio fibrivorans]MDR7092213.1 hypothetical protein [Cellvibrio fibrivorans]
MSAKMGKWVRHHATTTIVIIGVMLVGALASLLTADITTSFPFGCWSSSDECNSFSYKALGFWAAVVVMAIIAFFNTKAGLEDKIASDRELANASQIIGGTSEKIQLLHEMMATMPPKGFLKQYSKVACNALWKLGEARDYISVKMEEGQTPDPKLIAVYIRQVLHSILEITQVWDSHVRHVSEPHLIYRANIMVMMDTKSLTAESADFFKGILKFYNREHAIYGNPVRFYDSVLWSVPELSTQYSLEGNGFSSGESHDASIAEIALGVRTSLSGSPELRGCVPGAPYCIAARKPYWVDDTEKLWLNEQEDQNLKPLVEDIKGFYSGDSQVARSILSTPLPPQASIEIQAAMASSEGTAKTIDLIGVLNIFCNEKNILQNSQNAHDFISLVSPLAEMVSDLVAYYVECEPKIYSLLNE